MKKFVTALFDIFCAAAFVLCAWKFGWVRGVQAGSVYYVCLGLVWLAGAVIWAIRGIRALKEIKNQTDEV